MKWSLSAVVGSLKPVWGAAPACFFATRRFASNSIPDSQSRLAPSVPHLRPNPSAHPIPRLPVIDSMVEIARKLPLPSPERTVFIGVQHLLETTATLFKGLIDSGVRPENMLFAGKPYSTSSAVAAAISDLGVDLVPYAVHKTIGQYQAACREGSSRMWQRFIESVRSKNIERVVILDDGGRLLEAMPSHLKFEYKIAGIEQTRGGLYSPSLVEVLFPFIEVASSAVKRIVEPPFIVEAVLRKVRPIMRELYPDPSKTVVGVVGNGAIGSAIVHHSLSEGFKVIVCDEKGLSFSGSRVAKSFKHLYRVTSPAGVIAQSDCIFGCTGRDITEGVDVLGLAAKDKVFISCTSEDKEFLSLLRRIAVLSSAPFDPLEDILYTSEYGGNVLIVSGGFPINFDRKPYSVLSYDIEVTRALLFGACLQAMRCAATPIGDGWTINGHKLCLNPHVQRYVATAWGARQPKGRYSVDFFSQFDDVDSIAAKSGGLYHPDYLLEQAFACTYSPKEGVSPIPTPKT